MKGKLMSGIIVVTAMCSCTGNQAEADFGKVIPLPERMEMTGEGEFTLGRGVPVVFDGDDPDMARNAGFLKDYLKSDIGLEPELRPDGRGDNAIVLEQDTLMAEEEYRITVGEDGIVIAGGSPKGVFYGIQTLRKSVPVQEGKCRGVIFPFGEVSATPRFAYRGMHSDVVRHWFPVSYMKKYIDLMAFHGMNTLHWHLSDDQGWRIEIKRYPELTEKGSYRDGTMVGRDTSVFDGVPVSGYFTQDEIREVVKYAADRYITVIPEIDVPGHMMALLPQAPTLSRRAWGSRRSSPRRFSHSFLCWLSSELRIPEREPGTSPGLPSGSPSSLSISYVSLSQGLLSIRPGVLVLLSLTEGWLSGSSGCSLWLRLSVRFSVQESGNSFLLKKGNSGAVL